jgi:hypothetical protein
MTINRIALKAIVAAVLTLSAGYAAATGSQDLNVSAKVTTICKFTTVGAIAVPFVDIDPSTTGAKTKAIAVPYKCTNGTAAPGITITAGGTTLVNGTDATSITYSIGLWTTAAGAGFNAAAGSATATATIPEAQYRDATAGTYTDTVTLEIDN